MRSWIYSYKSSDGLRHEGEMVASCKDDVYAELRRQGIRAIRVDERIVPVVCRGFKGLRRRDWLLLSGGFVFVGIATLCFAYLGYRIAGDEISRSEMQTISAGDRELVIETPVHSAAYEVVVEKIESVRQKYRVELEKLDQSLLANYALIERTKDLSEFNEIIHKGRTIVAEAKRGIKEVFCVEYGRVIEDEVKESLQRIYGVLMEELDAQNERFDLDEYALEILEANRGRWRVVQGGVLWDDRQLERQFRFFEREQGPSASRWTRDFGTSGPHSIESKPVTVPALLRDAELLGRQRARALKKRNEKSE